MSSEPRAVAPPTPKSPAQQGVYPRLPGQARRVSSNHRRDMSRPELQLPLRPEVVSLDWWLDLNA
jgi:hypothetical protein